MFAITHKRPVVNATQASKVNATSTRIDYSRRFAEGYGRTPRNRWGQGALFGRKNRFSFMERFEGAMAFCAALAITSSTALAQNEPITPFKIETADWYIQVGV